MRSFITLIAVAAVGILIASSAVAAAGHGPQATPRATTGDITKLGSSRLSVGRLTCVVPMTSVILSGHFSLGERVTIDCLGDVLRLIKHDVPTDIVGTSPPGGSGTPATSTSGANGANGTSSNSVVTATSTSGNATSIAIASASSGSGGEMTTSVSAEGAVTAITSTSISIGQATCPFDPSSYPSQSPVAQLQVGDIAKITCQTSGDGSTTGSVSVP